MSKLAAISSLKKNGSRRRCLSCGTQEMGPGRRYCSKECRQQMVWVLSLSTGLLRVFNARYAAFSFDSGLIVLDVLPVWSKEISRFTSKRTNGKRPADDLKSLVLRSGGEWYGLIHSRNSKSYASLCILKKNHDSTITPESIKPNRRVRPRLSKREREYMKLLQLTAEELLSEGHAARIKSSYRKLAKLYHPDVGGDAKKFREINEAQQRMLIWAQCPQFTLRKALPDCWSYDGATNRWSPPL
jgi:hypothetical protein